MAVRASDKDSSVTGGFDAFYAHSGDRDGHVSIVEGECAVCGRGVYTEEEKCGGGAEREDVFYRGEEDSWAGWNKTDCEEGLRGVGEGLEVLAWILDKFDG